MKEIFRDTEDPLFVVEGYFDAKSIDGVATFGNKLTPGQIDLLKMSKRQKVLIPDTKGNIDCGIADQFLNFGWSISLPELSGCKDVNEAIIRFGKLYTIKQISDNIRSGELAEMLLRAYCTK